MYQRIMTHPEDLAISDRLSKLQSSASSVDSTHSAPPIYKGTSISKSVDEVGASHPFGVPEDRWSPEYNRKSRHNSSGTSHKGSRRIMDESPSRRSNNRLINRRSSSFSPESGWSSRSSSHYSVSSNRSRKSRISNTSAQSYSFPRNSSGSIIAIPAKDSQGSGQLPNLEEKKSLKNLEKLRLSKKNIPEMVISYDKIIEDSIFAYLSLSAQIDPCVLEQAELVKDLFVIQREFLLSSCRNRIPSAGSGPMQSDKLWDVRNLVNEYKDKSPYVTHLKFISETIGVIGWVTDREKPAHFIRDRYDRGKKYARQIRKSRSSMLAIHTDWIKSWQEVVLDLEDYVNKWHPKGLIWGKDD